MIKKLTLSLPLALAAYFSPASSRAAPQPECQVAYQVKYQEPGSGTKVEEGVEEENPDEEEKGEKKNAPKGAPEGIGARLEERTSIASLSRDTPVHDLTFRLGLKYNFLGIKGVKAATDEVSYNPQRLDVNLNLGLDAYLIAGASIATSDSAASSSLPPNFASQRDNNLRLGAGYEINRGYRLEGEAIVVRHAGKLLPGGRTRLIGDLFDANYGPVRGVDFQVGVNLIKSEPLTSTGPQLASQFGARFAGGRFIVPFDSSYARLSTQLASREGQVSAETGICWGRSWLQSCLGTELLYHRSPDLQEQSALTKLTVEMVRLPYR